jgi:CBS domain-containing protein
MSTSPFIPVSDVMTRDPVTVDGMVTVAEALSLMAEKRISAVVVDRRDERDEYALLLVADIAREAIEHDRPIRRTNVYELMVKPAPSVTAEMNIRYAIRFMMRCGFSHCVVLEERRLVGIVTLKELTIRYIRSTEA